jgi:hypothetical protein
MHRHHRCACADGQHKTLGLTTRRARLAASRAVLHMQHSRLHCIWQILQWHWPQHMPWRAGLAETCMYLYAASCSDGRWPATKLVSATPRQNMAWHEIVP